MQATQHLDSCVNALLVLNGAYDVVCAACILWLPTSPLGRLHLHVFKETQQPNARRVFAYWILAYGIDRILAGACKSPGTDAIAVSSYLVEAAAYYHETVVFTSVHTAKATFVYLASLFLAAVVAMRSYITAQEVLYARQTTENLH
jgi:hypothetical protein